MKIIVNVNAVNSVKQCEIKSKALISKLLI